MFFFVQYAFEDEAEIVEAVDRQDLYRKISPKVWSSVRGGYETEEELRKACGVLEDCSVCHTKLFSVWESPYKEGMLRHHRCWTCNYWMENRPGNSLVVEGHVYSVGSESDSFKGFGGRTFNYKMKGSDEVKSSSNLWSRGQVPEHLRHLWPDNAEFVDGSKWHRVGDISCFG